MFSFTLLPLHSCLSCRCEGKRDLKIIWLFFVGSILLLIFDRAYVVFTMITAISFAASMGVSIPVNSQAFCPCRFS